MKKINAQDDRDAYVKWMAVADAAVKRGIYRDAVQAAISAWPYIDGMMQYERKYEQKQFTTVPAIEIVLKYAPLLLDRHSLEGVDPLLRTVSRIERHAAADMGRRLSDARDHLGRTVQLCKATATLPCRWIFPSSTWTIG